MDPQSMTFTRLFPDPDDTTRTVLKLLTAAGVALKKKNPAMRKLRNVCYIIALLVGVSVVVITLDAILQNKNVDFVRQHFNVISERYINDRLQTIDVQQVDRIHHIISQCRNTTSVRPEVAAKHLPLYYYSKIYNFSFCKVPKIGSTFWTQAFAVLEKGLEKSEDIFKKDRYKIHKGMFKYMTDFTSEDRKRSQSILISRDPYSRLFSAFIDKSYLPNMAVLNEQISITMNRTRSGSKCSENPRFEDFLRHVIRKARNGKRLDRHWATIYSLCRPCDVNAFILVKQESFSKDVEYALKQMGVERDQYDVIVDALYCHRIEATVPGIVGTIMSYANSDKRVLGCFSMMEVMERAWISFQIQGFLKDSVRFPVERFSTVSEAQYTETLTQELLAAIENHPLSPEESKAQRRAALVKAYADISEETINDIRDIYHNDFEVFDYCKDPPKL